jgi:hypothetical protein
MPLNDFLAIRTDKENQNLCRKPRIPTVSTGILLISKTNFTFLNREMRSPGKELRIEGGASGLRIT